MNQDKALGAFIGAIIGDALGAPLEFKYPREQNTVCEMTGGGDFGWRPGQTTDDTALAMAVVDMYLSSQDYNQQQFVANMLAWQDTKPKDIGNWTRTALSEWRKNTSNVELRDANHPVIKKWIQRGSTDAGNGGIMRCWPTAIFRINLQVDDEVKKICEDTHPDPRCVASCQAVVEAISSLLMGYKMDTVMHNALYACRWQSSVADALETTERLPWKDWENSGYTVSTMVGAFAALQQAKSFEEGLTWTVNRSNDADTTGCIAGALLGAKYGFSSIPKRWLSKLEDADALIVKAQKLIDISQMR